MSDIRICSYSGTHMCCDMQAHLRVQMQMGSWRGQVRDQPQQDQGCIKGPGAPPPLSKAADCRE